MDTTEGQHETADPSLYERTKALLEPGDIDLNGVIVHTDCAGSDDIEMMDLTLTVADLIADHAGHDPTDVYVHSGNDDPAFAANQHQGRTLAADEFVWECQQLLREGRYHLVFYYEAGLDQDQLLAALRDAGHSVTGVRG